MAKPNDAKEAKRKPGRPAQADALTAAERSKRYRTKLKEKSQAVAPKNDASVATMDRLNQRLVELQMRCDQEHAKAIDFESKLLSERAIRDKPAPIHPLVSQVKALQKLVQEQDRTITACNAEINRLRDALSRHVK